MQKELLIIFIKNSIKGKVKTRLAKDLGDDKALEVYEQLLAHTQLISSKLSIHKSVMYSDYIEENDIWNTGDFTKDVQVGDDLGERMSLAFQKGFEAENQSICIIGSDCYDLSTEILKESFEQLKSHDFVIGPANDGGYYLLGMNKYYPEVFENKIYSTENVFQEAINEMQELNKSHFELPELTDIDDVNDLKKFE